MSQEDDDIQKSFAPPGAGLPVVQAFVLRHLVFPAYCLTTSWDKALAAFQAEGQKVIALVEPLSAEQLQRRVLVKAPMGIEDSSRYWSAAMVLEHLIEVGSRIAVGIVELTHGSTGHGQGRHRRRETEGRQRHPDHPGLPAVPRGLLPDRVGRYRRPEKQVQAPSSLVR